VRKPLAALVALIGLLAVACGSLAANAVTVNSTHVSEKSVDDELAQIRDNKLYREALNLTDVEGQGLKGTFSAGFSAQVVTLRIYYTLVHQAIEDRHITITAADLAKSRTTVEQQVGNDPSTGQPKAGLGHKVIAAFAPWYQRELIRRQAEVARLQAALSKSSISAAAIKRFYDENKSQFEQVCAMHVLVDTQDEANRVKAELSGGADFATVATNESKDPSAKQNHGDLGCAAPDNYVPEFAAAIKAQPLNVIGDPVHSQFGWHVIKVYERKALSLAEATPQIRQQLLQQGGGNSLNTWLLQAIGKAKISVNPRFGHFQRTVSQGELPHVVPPAAPATSTSTTRKR
jgi:PPIC-type PPIASE domain